MPLARSRGASVCGVFIHARVYQTDVWSHLSYSVKGDSQNFSKNVRASFHPTTVAGRPAPPLPKRTPSRGILRQFLKPGDIFPPGAREQGLQGRVALLQGLQIDLLVVGSAVLPAAEQDANRFESQGPDGGVMRLPSAHLQLVIGTGPVGLGDGVPVETVKGLTVNVGTIQTTG